MLLATGRRSYGREIRITTLLAGDGCDDDRIFLRRNASTSTLLIQTATWIMMTASMGVVGRTSAGDVGGGILQDTGRIRSDETK